MAHTAAARRCSSCDVTKPVRDFSASQITKRAPRCVECTPKQVVELRCFHCGKGKDRDQFSQIQVKMDEPTCLVCMKERINFQPGGVNEPGDVHEDEGYGDGDAESDGGTTMPASSVYGMATSSSTAGGVTVPLSNAPTVASRTESAFMKPQVAQRKGKTDSTDKSFDNVQVEASGSEGED